MDTSAEASRGANFDAPPVGEAILGIEFDPIQELGAIHLAQVASLWSPDYPIMKEVPGIPPFPRNPDGSEPPFAVHLGPAPSRLWLMSADEADLLQIQNDRLIVNWRKMRPESIYPRHAALASRLEKHWVSFLSYLQERSISLPSRVTVECSYVNTFDMGDDISRAISIFSRPPVVLPGEDDGLQFQLSRRLDFDGRLMIGGGPSPDAATGAERPYNLTVTAKLQGVVDRAGFPSDLVAAAHTFSVDAFTRITTSENHAQWGRTD